MRGLTLRAPWAFAISFLGKNVENREWDDRLARLNDAYSLPGQEVAIHGGSAPLRPKRKPWRELDPKNPWYQLCEALENWQLAEEMGEKLLTQEAHDYLTKVRQGGPLQPEHFVMTGVVAVATVQRVTRASQSMWATQGDLHIELAEVKVLPRPVACPGAQGLWTLPEAIEEAVRDELTRWSVAQVPVDSGKTAEEWLR